MCRSRASPHLQPLGAAVPVCGLPGHIPRQCHPHHLSSTIPPTMLLLIVSTPPTNASPADVSTPALPLLHHLLTLLLLSPATSVHPPTNDNPVPCTTG